MESVEKTIATIKENLSQKSASRKDEVSVMTSLMNDNNYTVDVYEKSGKCGEYNPSSAIRKLCTNVVSSTTKMPIKEAEELVNNYEFSKADAALAIGFSKEFVNTYLQTGRKLPLGGRIDSDISLMWKNTDTRTVAIPSENGKSVTVPGHGAIKVFSPCPSWIKGG